MILRASQGVAITIPGATASPDLITTISGLLAPHSQQSDPPTVEQPLATQRFICPDLTYNQARELLTTVSRLELLGKVHIQPLASRPVQLVAFDVDSTLVDGEVITMIADYVGVGEQVHDITTRAMHGELDFTESLRERVALLKGCPVSTLADIHATLPLNPGARELVATLRANDITVVMVSGGFSQVTGLLANELQVDYCFSNVLEVDEATQTLTGRTVGPIVHREAKAIHVAAVAKERGIALEHCVAVGDGANDLGMMGIVGFSVGYGHKEVVHNHADTSILDTNLMLLAEILDL